MIPKTTELQKLEADLQARTRDLLSNLDTLYRFYGPEAIKSRYFLTHKVLHQLINSSRFLQAIIQTKEGLQ